MTKGSLLAKLAQDKGLILVRPSALTVQRRRCGKGFVFLGTGGRPIGDPARIAWFRSLAVPPAYAKVRYSAEESAHLQAIGIDAAGRLQYRYHPRWTEVREALKARRLAGLAKALPRIRRAVGRALAGEIPDHRFAVAAVVELVSLTAIRAGSEEYARERGTRGATTLLKSNLRIGNDGSVMLHFKAKGGKVVTKDVRCARFSRVLSRLLDLPGRRVFQYRDAAGQYHLVRAADVNQFLREIAGRPISLKDFRTLVASAAALRALAATAPGGSAAQRRRQVRATVVEIAEQLANTPTVCRTSYVHDAVIEAFETGDLQRLSVVKAKSPVAQAELLAKVVARTRRAAS